MKTAIPVRRKAQKNFGTDGSAYACIRALGHTITELYPSLVQLKTDTRYIKTLKGIRAAACSEVYSAKFRRLHNNSNILCLGGRVIGPETAKIMVDAFVNTEFEGGRHQRRVDMIDALERGEKL